MHKIARFAFFSISARALARLPTSRLLPMTGPTTAFSVTGSHFLARSESNEELQQRLNSAQYRSCLRLQGPYPRAGRERDRQRARPKYPYHSPNFATSEWIRWNRARPKLSLLRLVRRLLYPRARLPPIALPPGLLRPGPAPGSRLRACLCSSRAHLPRGCPKPDSEYRPARLTVETQEA